MKKLFLFLSMIIMTLALSAQTPTPGQDMKTYYYAALGNTFIGPHFVPCKIYLASLKTNLVLTRSYPAGTTLAKAVSDGYLYYETPYTTTVTATTSVATPYLVVHEVAGTSNIAIFYNDKTTAGDSGVVINKFGYVGIGKNTASAALDVSGSILVNGSIGISGVNTAISTPRVTLTATTDTTSKTIGLIVIGTQLYYCNGTYYYKVTYAK